MRHPLAAVPLSLLVLVLCATPAFAHATFDVTQAPASSTQDFSLRVPLERDAVNDLVEVLVPGVFEVTACDGTEGWDCQQDTTQDGDTVVTLTRQPDGPGDAEQFALTMTAPTDEGVYTFPTIQTYDDGEEVAWINDPGTDRPAPRIQVGDETTEVEYAGDASPHTDLATEEPTDDPTPVETATDEPTDEPTANDEPADDEPAEETTASDEEIAGEAQDTPWLFIVVGIIVVGAGAGFALRRNA